MKSSSDEISGFPPGQVQHEARVGVDEARRGPVGEREGIVVTLMDIRRADAAKRT